MPEDRLMPDEKRSLLRRARLALVAGVTKTSLTSLEFDSLPENLRKPGATFVTLTIDGQLRGCVGTLEAYQPLIADVEEHAVAAALNDYRFPPVQPDELGRISIEISRLTTPKPLDYTGPDELAAKLRPGLDGVVLKDGLHRATFLPQVWEKLPSPDLFLDQLCLKMGQSPDLWRKKKLEVYIYQVEEFHE